MKGLLLSDLARQSPSTFGIIDHFTGLDTTKFSTTISDLGSVAVGDAVGGVAVITPSDATIADNDESYLQSKEVFRIASQKPIEFAARVQFTQAATNAANILAGLRTHCKTTVLVLKLRSRVLRFTLTTDRPTGT
jgi:hypothetical protein